MRMHCVVNETATQLNTTTDILTDWNNRKVL